MAVGFVLAIAAVWVLMRTVHAPEGGRTLVDVLTGGNRLAPDPAPADKPADPPAQASPHKTTTPPAPAPADPDDPLGTNPILELPGG